MADTFGRLLIAIAIVVVAARLAGLAVKRVGQPQVMGEIVAGIALGPSVLGAISSDAKDALFPAEIIPFLSIIAQLGLIFFMFLIGLELDPKLMRGQSRTVGFVFSLSLSLPFILGVVTGLIIHGTLAPPSPLSTGGPLGLPGLGNASPLPDIDRLSFCLFLGAALSITAFPVLARLLNEKGLSKTPVGVIALTCAAVEDVCAWLILAVVVAIVRSSGAADTLLTLLYTTIFICFMLFAVRPGLAWLVRRWRGTAGLGAGLLTVILVGVLLSAYATEEIGIHAIFGAFIFGAMLPRESELVHEVTLKLEDFTVLLFLPVFFAITGLKTELAAIDSGTVALIAVAVLVAAMAGKLVGAGGGAKLAGMPTREASLIGLLMNTRGLTELVIISVGKELGVVPDSLFAILVLMALATTFMAAPLIDILHRRTKPVFRPSQVGLQPGATRPRRILAALDGSAGDTTLVDLAALLAEPTGASLTLARVLEEPERLSRRTSAWSASTAEERALGAMTRLATRHPDVTIATLATTVTDVGVGVCREVEKADADLVLIGWNRSLLGTNVLGGAVGTVLARCPADVAVLVDQTGKGVSLERGETVLVPFGGGTHESAALQLASRLAAGTGNPLAILARDETAREKVAEAAETGARVELVEGSAREALERAVETAGVLVLGAAEDWALEKRSFGRSRARLVAGVVKPVLVVRKGEGAETAELESWLKNARKSQIGDWLGTRAGAVPAPATAEPAGKSLR